MKNPVLIGTALANQVRFYFVNHLELAQCIKAQGEIFPCSLIPLVNALSINGIMGLMEKNNTKVCSIIEGGGPIGEIVVQSNPQGQVRGLVTNRYVNLPLVDNYFDIIGSVGNIGNIKIIKDYHLKTPYNSETSIIKGDILSDYSYYFAYSQQTPSAISGGLKIDQDYNILGGGILMVQVLPDCDETIIAQLENIMLKYKNISDLLVKYDQQAILDLMFADDYKILETKTLTYHCDCSYEKCVSNLNLLSDKDKQELLQDDNIEIVCDWCLKKYHIAKKDIKLKNDK